MRTTLSFLASLSIVAAGVLVAAGSEAANPAAPVPTSAAPTSVPTAPPPAPAAVPAAPVIAQLKDGTKIEMDADGSVFALNADGSKTPVPDGILTLRDSTTFLVKDGKRVDDE